MWNIFKKKKIEQKYYTGPIDFSETNRLHKEIQKILIRDSKMISILKYKNDNNEI